jgi:arylformamidase
VWSQARSSRTTPAVGAGITASILRDAEIPPRTRRLLFKTRNSDYWASGNKEFQTDFVGLSVDAAELLVDRNVKLLGIDYLSIAPYKQGKPVHTILLDAGVVLIEGLDLSKVSQGRYTLTCCRSNWERRCTYTEPGKGCKLLLPDISIIYL